MASMKIIVATSPTIADVAPARTASAPSSAPTVRCSSTFMGAGSAPARSSTDSSLALSGVKFPSISPDPPGIGPLMLGASMTFLSGRITELARANAIEAEFDDRTSATLLVETGMGVGEHLAVHHEALLDHVEGRDVIG